MSESERVCRLPFYMSRPAAVGLLLVAFALGGAAQWLGNRYQQRADERRTEKMEFDTLCTISDMVRRFNGPSSPAYQEHYLELIRDNPEFLNDNPTNQGAELLYLIRDALLQNPGADTDHDGRLETQDVWGNPLIFLSEDRKEDLVIDAEGRQEKVSVPPFFGGAFYVNTLRHHMWLETDAEAIAYELGHTQPADP